MNNRISKLLSIMPLSSSFRGTIYRLFNRKGNIGKGFRIGFGSYIDSNIVKIGDNVSIGNLVRIKCLDRFEVGVNTSIGSSTVICGAKEEEKFLNRDFICGSNVGILCSHYFDVVAPIVIGNDVVIAGNRTQFYTHSDDLSGNRLDGGINIGNHVYIGAASLINLGVTICDNVVIQGGCCVNKDINKSGVYASQTIYRRGNIRNYSELFIDRDSKVINTGARVYSKEIKKH